MLRKWSTMLVTATVTTAVLLTAGLLAFGGGNDGSQTRPGTDTTPAPIPNPGGSASGPTIGPEGVPLLEGAPLGPAPSPKAGSSSGGVPCGSREQLGYHVHARLTLFVNGEPRSVPLGIGIGTPRRIDETARGQFVAGGRCFAFLHTHATDGIIHIEAPAKAAFKLGQFFHVWRLRLDRRHLGPISGRVVAYLNGDRFRGDPRAIPLGKHAQIQLEVGQPLMAPESIQFPPGL